MTLTHTQARAFYDRFGASQDWQRYYEVPAEKIPFASLALAPAREVFEFGCVTGRLVETPLRNNLAPHAVDREVDISSTMVSLTRARVAHFGERAQAAPCTGEPILEDADKSFERSVSIYALDLLPAVETAALVGAAQSILSDDGLAGFINPTRGLTAASRLVERALSALCAWRPSLVGGCRPISVGEHAAAPDVDVRDPARVPSFGVPSEIVVARKLAQEY